MKCGIELGNLGLIIEKGEMIKVPYDIPGLLDATTRKTYQSTSFRKLLGSGTIIKNEIYLLGSNLIYVTTIESGDETIFVKKSNQGDGVFSAVGKRAGGEYQFFASPYFKEILDKRTVFGYC